MDWLCDCGKTFVSSDDYSASEAGSLDSISQYYTITHKKVK